MLIVHPNPFLDSNIYYSILICLTLIYFFTFIFFSKNHTNYIKYLKFMKKNEYINLYLFQTKKI